MPPAKKARRLTVRKGRQQGAPAASASNELQPATKATGGKRHHRHTEVLLLKVLHAAASPRMCRRQSSRTQQESSHAQQRIRPSNRVQRPILTSELPRERPAAVREVPHSFRLVRLSRQVMLCCCWISRPRPKRRRPFRLPLRQAVLQPRLPPLSTSRPPPRWSSSSWALACTLGLHESVSRRRCAPCASAWSENCASSCS